MPAVCRVCKETIELFKDDTFEENCRFCGEPIKELTQDEIRTENRKYFLAGIILTPLMIGIPVIMNQFEIGWIPIFITLVLVLVFFILIQSAWDWLKHRNSPPGIKLK